MINFTKDLLAVNPAYNDSIIQFESTITNAVKAVISIEGIQFQTIPINGKFTFNFKEIIKSIINTNRFEDDILPDLGNDVFIYYDDKIVKKIEVVISVQSLTANEQITKNYTFIRSVEQLMNYRNLINITADIKVLLPSKNYVDYHLKYFEGYPFDFAIYGIKSGDTFYLRNITTNQQTEIFTATTSNALRVFLSDGANSTTDTDILIQSSTLNRLELFVNGHFKANISVSKVESDSGVYLKWINSKGSYSYWKFDRVFKSLITPKTIDDFEGSYDNLQNLNATSYIIGKTANQTIQVDSNYNSLEAEYLKDLITSPSVWMYRHQTAFNQQMPFDFIGVKLSDTAFTAIDTKNSKNRVSLTITLPTFFTQTN